MNKPATAKSTCGVIYILKSWIIDITDIFKFAIYRFF